jgi:sugar porter (SP) family MFS transporter
MNTAPIEKNPAGAAGSGEYRSGYVWFVSLVAALGGLLFGYDWVVIGGAKPFYEKFFHITDANTQGWAMSCALLGALAGATLSGMACDRWGRKRMLIAAALLFAISSLGTGLAGSFGVFIAWRMAGGAAVGLASNISPLYIAEIAPAHLRGRLVSLNQFTIVIGILLAQIVNWLIAQPVPEGATAQQILESWNGQAGWRWMFGVTAIPSALFLAGALFVPESPRWLAKQGRVGEARAVLGRVAGKAGGETALTAILQTLGGKHEKIEWRALFEPRMRRLLVLGIALAVFQQWCGINVVFNYAEEIFSAAGYSVSDILFNIVITGSVNVVFTLVALGTVDKIGRRPLMLFGSAGLAVIYILLGASYAAHTQGAHVLVLVLGAIACYAMSLAPVTWVVISEIFPNRIRGVAMSVAVGFLWLACFVLTFTFPILNRALGPSGTFWIYAAVCVIGFAFMFFRLPETKGRTLEELENDSKH